MRHLHGQSSHATNQLQTLFFHTLRVTRYQGDQVDALSMRHLLAEEVRETRAHAPDTLVRDPGV